MEQYSRLEYSLIQLKKKGYKYTKKREEILHFLIQENRYLSAKEVYEYMNRKYEGISYDTIYRNLNDFVAIELLEETELNGERKYRFHCSHDGTVGHHHHFICLECGATNEIHMCPMTFFTEQLEGCTIEGHRFEIYGKCPECSKK